jgi:KipI family sensor histidine kinase inhibitor
VQECVPTYCSLLIYYDPSKISYENLVYQLKDLEPNIHEFDFPVKKVIEVPVVYGGSFGPDLNYVAEFHGLSGEEVIKIHTEREYTVYMIGFVAGFPYLGEVSNAIATPRMETPRLQVPAGSVGIAGNQTGIYPCRSPGGWRIIGRTYQILFDPHKNPPSLLRPGDIIRLKPVAKENCRDQLG